MSSASRFSHRRKGSAARVRKGPAKNYEDLEDAINGVEGEKFQKLIKRGGTKVDLVKYKFK